MSLLEELKQKIAALEARVERLERVQKPGPIPPQPWKAPFTSDPKGGAA
jgi:hypothetical protein